ncbi:MAG TPA: VOC family protein [Xanthobacteraceae bacterium]|nr:VOC family protein [Xanthobacteraceae bacterium]
MIKITGFEHVSIASDALEPGSKVLALFGIKPTGFEEIHTQAVTSNYFEEPESGVRFEIIRPGSDDSHLHKFLKERGPGLHHVCLQVENLDDAVAQVKAAGGTIVGHVFSDSRGRHAFVHPKSTGGVLIGMIELHPELKKK